MRPAERRGAFHAAKGGNSRREASIHANAVRNSCRRRRQFIQKSAPEGALFAKWSRLRAGKKRPKGAGISPFGRISARLAPVCKHPVGCGGGCGPDSAPRKARAEPDPMKGDASRQKKAQPAWGCALSGGATRNRTGDEGFADLCLTAWLWRRIGESDRGCGALNRGSARNAHGLRGEKN